MHRGTRRGVSSLSMMILDTLSVFRVKLGITRVSCERKLKYTQVPHSQDCS